MPQRLVIRVPDTETMSLGELDLFVRRAKEYGLTAKDQITPIWSGEEFKLYVDLPEGVRVVAGKRVVVRPPTKKQVAVKKQIETHREKKAKGEPEAYVPPEGRKTPPTPRKVKCPVCNIRKPVVKIAKQSVIKPHVFHGEPCEGSGQSAPSASRKKKA